MKYRFLLSPAARGHAAIFLLVPLGWLGCSDPTPSTPQAAIYSNVTAGAKHTAAQCMIGGGTDWVNIGKISQTLGVKDGVPEKILRVPNGGSSDGLGVTVECSVSPTGDKLQVHARAALTGTGSIIVNGLFAKAPADGSPIPPQMNVEAFFHRNDYGPYTSKTCVMTFPRPEMGLAPTRIWGQLDCPDIANDQQGRVCEAHAEILFEKCTE